MRKNYKLNEVVVSKAILRNSRLGKAALENRKTRNYEDKNFYKKIIDAFPGDRHHRRI